MNETIRCFVAIDLPQEVKETIGAYIHSPPEGHREVHRDAVAGKGEGGLLQKEENQGDNGSS